MPTPITVTGALSTGPGGCRQLTTDVGVAYGLAGDMVRDLTDGQRITLRGVPGPDRSGVCQGDVLRVLEVTHR